MEKLMFLLSTGIIASLLMVSISSAADCKEGKAMLDKAFANAPDEMTGQYIEMAVQSCPDNADLLKRIAQYYEHWYKTELNPDKQADYKRLAQDYYRKTIATEEGGQSEEMKTQLAKLENDQEFNEVTFRALRPSSKGKTGSGLNLDVRFERNSYALSDTAQKHLDVLGRLLVEQKTVMVSLEGHTDMTGTAEYNKGLSLKRAESAREYIVSTYNIQQDRISVSGFGFEHLADRQDPYSVANRRVEVIKLSE